MGDRQAAAMAHAASPGTLAALHGALKARMTVVAGRFPWLETKSRVVDGQTVNDTRAPTVGDGWLALKSAADDEQLPIMLVRPRTGQDTEQGADQTATARVDILVGTYSDTDDGWLDVLLLVDAIRDDLNAAPAISGTAFEQVGPMSWEIYEQQPRPQWWGTVSTTWVVPRARRVESRNPEEV